MVSILIGDVHDFCWPKFKQPFRIIANRGSTVQKLSPKSNWEIVIFHSTVIIILLVSEIASLKDFCNIGFHKKNRVLFK